MMSLLVQLFSNEESTNDLPVPSMLASRCRFHGIGRLEYKDWKIRQLGIARYQALERQARSIIKLRSYEQAQVLAELKAAQRF
jgi:hypothetical protein